MSCAAPGREPADAPDPPDAATLDPGDLAVVEWQLGRSPRGIAGVAHRCPCGAPDVVHTRPRLPDGTPFPTTFYATCPRLTGAISTLESAGVMREMSERLATDETLAAAYVDAHEDYLARRAELGSVPEIAEVSAGGMPTRVKCLHAHVAHSLAVGRGVNPFGDEALALLTPWWRTQPCRGRARLGLAPEAAADAGPNPDGKDRAPSETGVVS